MQLALCHNGDTWYIARYLPAEDRTVENRSFASALSARAYVARWCDAGAIIRPQSQCIYDELLVAVQAEAGVVRAVGE